MKALPPPDINDAAVLATLAADPLKDLRFHAAEIPRIQQQYLDYAAVAGDASHPNAPVPMGVAKELKTLLRGYHSRKEGSLAFIDEIKRSSKDVCPLCGSLGSATTDHVFPAAIFAEFAIFSRNLVPACGECNSHKGNVYRGLNLGDRVIHPYYDQWLTARAVAARLEPRNGNYQTPSITLQTVLGPPGNPLIATVEYHLHTVILRTDIDRFLDDFWTKLVRKPERYFVLPAGQLTLAQVRAAVSSTLQNTDEHFGTPNNWESMILAGLLDNSDALDYLHNWITDLRIDPTRAEDV